MRRSGVRFPTAAPRCFPYSTATFRQGAIFLVRSPHPAVARWCPEPLGRVPRIAAHHVPVQRLQVHSV
jgi:hypothetical protein